MSAWKPIETAPKDGTEIYAGAQADWVKAFLHVPYPMKLHFADGRWLADDGKAYEPQPTHWMPAPAFDPKFVGLVNTVGREPVPRVPFTPGMDVEFRVDRAGTYAVAAFDSDQGGEKAIAVFDQYLMTPGETLVLKGLRFTIEAG